MVKKEKVVHLVGKELLHDPLLNKGTGFTKEERKFFQLEGLLPGHVSTIEEQLQRRYENLSMKNTNLDKWELLMDLQNRNETLFYRLVLDKVDEMLPLVYTPTVGEASINFSLKYHQSRGVFISVEQKDVISEILDNTMKKEVDVIVVTDGGRILGLGDLGAGGMAIPVGKLSLYTLFGGIDPSRVLPIFLDVGTNNPKLLNDPLYLGLRKKRVLGEEYEEFIDAFVMTVKKKFPKVLLQWEDFTKDQATTLLKKYQKKLCSFNDDIQGTAIVTVSGIIAALKTSKQELSKQVFTIFGAGSAGIGIANYLVEYMQEHGLSEEEARKKIFLLDRHGLLRTNSVNLSNGRVPFAKTEEDLATWDTAFDGEMKLECVVRNSKSTALIGVSAQHASFTESIVKMLCTHTPRPIIFPLSNPNSCCEADPKDLFNWSDGSALVATGSPYPPVEYKGKSYVISQCNNVYAFPAIGLAVSAVNITELTDSILLEVVDVLSSNAPSLSTDGGSFFPSFHNLRHVIIKAATAVARQAIKEGLANPPPHDSLEELIKEKLWYPEYVNYVRTH